jgi:hypothetical protein
MASGGTPQWIYGLPETLSPPFIVKQFHLLRKVPHPQVPWEWGQLTTVRASTAEVFFLQTPLHLHKNVSQMTWPHPPRIDKLGSLIDALYGCGVL